MSALPRYQDLPAAPRGGRSAWGQFGPGDNLGLVNLMTQERVAAAASLVRKGRVFPLDLPVGSVAPALARLRGVPRHAVLHQPGTVNFDDVYDNFYPQASSQWDSLGHIGYAPDEFYNGATEAEVASMLGFLGLIMPPIVLVALGFAGIHLSVIIPVWVALVFAAVFFFLPDLELRQQVDKRRRDFRHAIGAFLDLVAMNLSGGRGVPEALMAASEIGEGWAFWRIRDALANARITGQTPWQALGVLGEEVQVSELKDLSAALSLVAEDGAKVRESLTARAASLRRRELADLEGQAGERSQSMLVAQMLLAGAFLVFLMYPAIQTLLHT